MKIAIPADDRNMEGNVSSSFGRAPYYLIYDTDSQSGEFIENSAARAQGGAGIKAAQEVVDARVQILVTPRLGEHAARVLEGARIRSYQCIPGSLIENINAFTESRLEFLQEIHPGYHGH